MPSWPNRLHLGSPASNNVEPSALPSSQERSIHRGHHQGIPREEEALHGKFTLDPSDLSTTSNISRPFQHGRSISQPFPCGPISAGVREKNSSNVRGDTEIRLDRSFHIAPGVSTTYLMASTQKGSSQIGDVDLTKGKCATCNSLVLWPRLSDVFRCTVCLMVNDLKPPPTGQQNDHCGSTHPSAEFPLDTKKLKPVSHVSLSKTKAIIEDCIALYLKAQLGNGKPETKDENYKDSKGTSNTASSLMINQPHVLRTPGDQANRISSVATEYQNKIVPESLYRQKIPARPAMHPNSFSVGLRSPVPQDCPTTSTRHIQRPPSRAPPPPPTTVLHALSSAPLQSGDKAIDLSTSIFRPLENYIVACFAHCNVLNASFPMITPSPLPRVASEAIPSQSSEISSYGKRNDDEITFSEMDAKTLLLGDFAENGMWWTGRGGASTESSRSTIKKADERAGIIPVSHKLPRIHLGELSEWYHIVLSAGRSWKQVLREVQTGNFSNKISIEDQQQIEKDLSEACSHVQRTLLKASENLLRRPGVLIKRPEDSRFLFMLLANPTLNASKFGHSSKTLRPKNQRSMSHDSKSTLKPVASCSRQALLSPQESPNSHYRDSSAHKNAGIVKRILGLISNLPDECHHHFVIWLSRFPESQFRRIVDLVGGFVTHRLTRQHGRKRSTSHGAFGELVPSVSGTGIENSAQLHAALGAVGPSKGSSNNDDVVSYSEDWQIRAAARVMSLLYSANNNGPHRRQDALQALSFENGAQAIHPSVRYRIQLGQLLPTSSFYNSLLDYSDLVTDFETWESRRGKFSFCQYPMFLSIWAKIHIMEYDARRQMEVKAREAFFNNIMGRKAISQYLLLRVRRECLVEDSLRGVSEVVGAGQEEIKKGLRIEFLDEEGIDAGGLRKEWFLLLVREVFDPEHGLFVYDDDSQYCYFNPNSFETSDQFFLVGVVLGLAIYNSTILDVALPTFAFRKLLASTPNYNGPMISVTRPLKSYNLDDLAEFRPSLAKGLRQLLEYDGDVEETFCRNFVAEVDRYDQILQVPLCPEGENRPVTNTNRREFVDLYINYLLDSAVSRQFEPFKRGFFTVCGGNALSLFSPDEIELLVRGSDEPLDVSSLRAVAIFDGWGKERLVEDESVINWFWETFSGANAIDQRKLLRFITSSDRIPAMGAANLVIKLTCLGNDINRFPIARTCFNMLGLYRYPSKRVLETKLWRAVEESEGFGMK